MNNDKPFRGRFLIVGAVTALALSVGGVAYAVSGDQPAPDPGYVQIVEGDRADDARTAQNGDNGWDCPEKRGDNGNGGGNGGSDNGGNARNAADQL